MEKTLTEKLELMKVAETYADTKNAINQLTSKLKDLEAQLKESGLEKIETDTFKIAVYATAPKKTFNLDKFKEMNPDIDYSKPEYYKEIKGSLSIRYTKKEVKNGE